MKVETSSKRIIWLIGISILFGHCKKNASTDPRFDGSIQIKLLPEGLAYAKLDIGKYFIYKDSATGQTDSVVVTKSIIQNKFTPSTTGIVLGINTTFAAYNTEIYSLTLSKIGTGGSQITWLDAETRSALCCPSISKADQPVILYQSDEIVFNYPFSSFYPYTAIVPSLAVEGKVYNDVLQTVTQRTVASTTVKADFYWAKGVGIIKKTHTSNNASITFTLVRSS